MKLLTSIFLLLGTIVLVDNCVAQNSSYKICNDQRIARPVDLPVVKISEFEVN